MATGRPAAPSLPACQQVPPQRCQRQRAQYTIHVGAQYTCRRVFLPCLSDSAKLLQRKVASCRRVASRQLQPPPPPPPHSLLIGRCALATSHTASSVLVSGAGHAFGAFNRCFTGVHAGECPGAQGVAVGGDRKAGSPQPAGLPAGSPPCVCGQGAEVSSALRMPAVHAQDCPNPKPAAPRGPGRHDVERGGGGGGGGAARRAAEPSHKSTSCWRAPPLASGHFLPPIHFFLLTSATTLLPPHPAA